MARIKKRRYGRTSDTANSSGATHVIKIGFNAGTSDRVKPGKFAGFVIYRDTLDQNNTPVIDFDAMKLLGSTPEQIDEAKKAGFKGEGLIPQQLRFILMGDAVKLEDGSWAYPGTYNEAYECYNKIGLWCQGDGEHATRKMEDGSKRQIPCNPYGKEGVDPSEFCEHSGPGCPCKLHFRLVVCLYGIDDQGNRFLVSTDLGRQARYRFDSTSEYGSMGTLDALDSASERLNGRINGITGTLTFQRKGRRTGNEKFAKSIVGHVLFALDEEAIMAREAEFRQQIEQQEVRRIQAATLGLPAPEAMTHVPATHDEEDKQEDFEQAQDAVEVSAEVVEPEPQPEPEPTPEPATLTIADATIDQLIEALRSWAFKTAAESNVEVPVVLASECYFEHAGQRHEIDNTDWFRQGADASKQAGREKLLREICTRLESDPNFELTEVAA